MKYLKAMVVTGLLVAFLALWLPGTGDVVAAMGMCGPWRLVASPQGSGSSMLQAVTAISTNDVWAVGGGEAGILSEHWDGSRWSLVPVPALDFSDLVGVAAAASDDIWAVGSYQDVNGITRPLIVHWNGHIWQIVASPRGGAQGAFLNSVTVAARNDVWAVGVSMYGKQTDRTFIEHWDGARWSVITSPNTALKNNDLDGISADGANDIWAVGRSFNTSDLHAGQTLMEYWNGSSWRIVPGPHFPPRHDVLNGVSALSPNDVWAVGSGGNVPDSALIEHWDGSRWRGFANPDLLNLAVNLRSVAARSSNDVWAAGNGYDFVHARYVTVIEHWDGTRWSQVATPTAGIKFNGLIGLTNVPGSVQTWAVGFSNISRGMYAPAALTNCPSNA